MKKDFLSFFALILSTIAFSQNYSEPVTIETNEDRVLNFNNTDNSWQYVAFNKSGARKAWFGLASDNNLYFTKEGGGDVIINGGDLGIGTNAPIGKFDINPGGWGNMPKISFNQKNDHPSMRLYRPTGSTSPRTAYPWWIENSSQGRLVFKSGTPSEIGLESVSTKVTFLPNGNVGIGTENTFGYKLAVNGTIGSIEVNVENTSPWPDFVFSKDYDLLSIEEVEKHITEKGHLPEIPNEAEVTKNGINLGEMDAKLLQKIEELTLYMIDVNKQLQSQKEIMQQLKQENLELKKEISTLKN